jgi:AraC-like DNA-binding protein
MQLAVYDLVGALFAPSDPWPVSRHADKLFARIRGLVKDGFADPDFGPREVAAVAGISLRYLQKLFTARGTTCIASLGSRRALGASPGTGHRPASQRDRLRLWLSRLPSFRAKISQSVRLCTRYPRRTS